MNTPILILGLGLDRLLVVRCIDDDGKEAVIHKSTKPGYPVWQVSFIEHQAPVGDTAYDSIAEALESVERSGYRVVEARWG